MVENDGLPMYILQSSKPCTCIMPVAASVQVLTGVSDQKVQSISSYNIIIRAMFITKAFKAIIVQGQSNEKDSTLLNCVTLVELNINLPITFKCNCIYISHGTANVSGINDSLIKHDNR